MRGGRVFYSVFAGMSPGEPVLPETRLPKKAGEAALSLLADAHVGRWRSAYGSEEPICDGIQWSLEYKEADKRCRHIAGDNAYPPDWEDFLEAADALAPAARLIDPERLERVELIYRRRAETGPGDPAPVPETARDHTETLTLDRKAGTLTYRRADGAGRAVGHAYRAWDDVADLLDACGTFFGRPGDAGPAESGGGSPVLSMEWTRHDGEHGTCERGYSRRGLPGWWGELLHDLSRFMSFYGLFGEIFDSGRFRHGVQAGECIYCSVEFAPGSKTYYYRTDDDSLKVRDRVVVPVGNDGGERTATVVAVEYFPEESVPLPLDRTKSILRRLDGPFSPSCGGRPRVLY